MRLTIYGRTTVLKALLITLLIDIIALLVPNDIVKAVLLIVSIIFIAFTLFFFRDPIRKIPTNLSENVILSPADGKIMLVSDSTEDNFIKAPVKIIGIFLSPFNVHVNRIPVSGEVKFLRYIKGNFTAAYNLSSAEKNERTEIGIETTKHKILFKQIAGVVARRIVCRLKIGEKVIRGEKFGMIKFGSRTDIVLPHNSVIKVKLNQKVKAGITEIAELPQ